MNLEKTVENLRARGFETHVMKTKEEAADFLVSRIRDTTVGLGGSMTLGDMDIYDRLQESNTVYWHQIDGSAETTRKATDARVYLSSANAVAETGEIVNIDGRANRVAGTLYDKDEVYIIIGTNKLTPDFHSAVERARNVASPKNAQRLKRNTPCAVKADKCYDCNSPDRICRGLVVHWGKTLSVGKMHVVIIEQELGY